MVSLNTNSFWPLVEKIDFRLPGTLKGKISPKSQTDMWLWGLQLISNWSYLEQSGNRRHTGSRSPVFWDFLWWLRSDKYQRYWVPLVSTALVCDLNGASESKTRWHSIIDVPFIIFVTPRYIYFGYWIIGWMETFPGEIPSIFLAHKAAEVR